MKVTASDQALTTQNSKMQPDLIMIKVNKSQDKQHKIKLTAVNLDKSLDKKINTD